MNGANGVDEQRTIRPKPRITRRIGSSHHFLLWRRNSQNSRRRSGAGSVASSSKLLASMRSLVSDRSKLPEIPPQIVSWGARLPIREGPRFEAALKSVAADEAE